MTAAQNRLAAYLESRRDTPWAWGTHDCMQFCAAGVKAITGIDYAERFGVYRSRLGAYRILSEYADLSAFITSILGEPLPRNAVRDGYVVTAYGPYGEMAGIGVGSQCFFAASPQGITGLRASHILRCWAA